MNDFDRQNDRSGEFTRRAGDSGRGQDRDDYWREPSRRLRLDPARRRIVGVCAGIARYYEVEPWVIRLIAVTALLFFPGIVFPAYWVAYFVMERPPRSDGEPRSHRFGHVRRLHAHRARSRDAYSSPAPELGPRFSPRRGLRDVKADLNEVELRLRRMEAHVTSGRYELQRELHKIDPGTAR